MPKKLSNKELAHLRQAIMVWSKGTILEASLVNDFLNFAITKKEPESVQSIRLVWAIMDERKEI